MTARLARILVGIATAIVVTSVVATLAWALSTLGVRPLDGVEGDVFFEADRLRAGLPLYVDLRVGALEYGPPPSRYLVLYPPLWSAILALFPRASMVVVGRLVATSAWFGAIGLVAWRAPRARRRAVVLAGAFVAGLWVVALYGATARPDALAVLLSAFALERVARRAAKDGGPPFDLTVGVAFALAAFIKPNVIGTLPGALLGSLLAARGPLRDRLRAVTPGALGGVVVSLGLAAVLRCVSHGVWLEHLFASTGQPPSMALWLDQMGGRAPFFALPFAATLALGVRARRAPAALVATTALATSVAWTTLALAKTGSAANYFMEPCVAMLVVLAHAPIPTLSPRASLVAATMLVVQAAWDGTASLRSALEDAPRAGERAGALARVRAMCGAAPDDVVLADEPGLERMLDGRLVMTPFQSTHLVRRGLFPVDLWRSDVQSKAVRCLVMQDDLLERPLSVEDAQHDRFPAPLREALRARFELVQEVAGYFVYRARRDGGRGSTTSTRAR